MKEGEARRIIKLRISEAARQSVMIGTCTVVVSWIIGRPWGIGQLKSRETYSPF